MKVTSINSMDTETNNSAAGSTTSAGAGQMHADNMSTGASSMTTLNNQYVQKKY